MAYNNFSVSKKMAQFYLKESQPTEGYIEVTYGEGKKTYHKYFKQVKGTPVYFGAKEVEYEGRILKFLELTLKDGDDMNKISVPLKNKAGYTDEARKIISIMNKADITEPIVLSMRNSKYTNSKGVEKEDLQIYGNYVERLNEDGRGLTTGFIPFDEIPKPESKTVAGDTVWDWTPQTEFYYQKFLEIETKFKDVASQETNSKKEPAKKENKKEYAEADESNDLPF